MIHVLVLADSAVVRAGLEAMLREDRRFEPVRGHASLADLAKLSTLRFSTRPDVVLAEFGSDAPPDGWPGRDAGSPPLVLLMEEVSRPELLRALRGGARSVLPRDAEPEEICAAIEAAAAGLTSIGPGELDLLLPSPDGAASRGSTERAP